jgi:intracellular protein transport protein USO1
LIFRHLED